MPNDASSTQRVFEGVRFHVVRAAFPKRGGGDMQREVVVPHDAVVILALLDTLDHGGSSKESGPAPAAGGGDGADSRAENAQQERGREPTRGREDEQVVLIRNERPAVGQTLWELPAGTLEAGEQPIHCAARELTEETGYQAQHLTAMGGFYTSPGFCTENMHAFLAGDLVQVGQKLDDTERIDVQPTPFSQALAMIRDHRIHDAKTIAALLHYHMFLRE